MRIRGTHSRVAALASLVALQASALGVSEAQVVGGSDLAVGPPARYVTDVGVSEDAQSLVHKRLNRTLLDGLRRFDFELASQAFADDFVGRFPSLEQGQPVADDLLEIERYVPDDLGALDRAGMVAALRSHTAAWVSVDRASWQMFEFLLEPSLDRAFARAHLQLGGATADGGRAEIEFTVKAELVRAFRDEWRIRRLDFIDATRVDNASPPFRDITDAVGLHFNRSAANAQLRQDVADTGVSLIDSALSVVDWNRDGFWDILATEAASHRILFLNDGRGGFVREALPRLDDVLIPSQLLFVDLDGDGLEELVGSRIVYRGARAWLGLHTRRNDEWVYLPRALEFDNPPGVRRHESQLLTAGDVNADGLLDLFVGGYQNNQSGNTGRFNRIDAEDGDDNLLFINRGGLRFTEESESRGITGTRYTYVAQFFDFDRDGDLDLFEGNDFGRNLLWDNQGDGTFRSLDDHPLARHTSNTMGVTIGDWDNTGSWGVYLSNMYSHAGHRVVRLTESVSDEMQTRLGVLTRGNQLFSLGADTGSWTDRGVPLRVNQAGWAWASLFYDLDNDGDKEIFVTTGNTSSEDPEAPDF